MNQLAAIVLCGGASRRMGRDKAWLQIDGEPLLTRVVRGVVAVANPVIVVAGPTQTIPALPEPVNVVRDVEEYRGPCLAFKRGLDSLPDDRPVFLCAGDMPFITAALIATLGTLYRPGHVVLPVLNCVSQPLAAIYPPEVRHVGSFEENRSMHSLLDQLPMIEVTEAMLKDAGHDIRVLIGINDPDEYRRACD